MRLSRLSLLTTLPSVATDVSPDVPAFHVCVEGLAKSWTTRSAHLIEPRRRASSSRLYFVKYV